MIFEILSVTHGIGRHMYYLSPTSIPLASKWSRATTPPNLAACALARISVCLFFMRILSRGDRKKTLIFLWALIALNISVNIVSIVGMLVRCRPIEKLWDHNVPGVCGPASTSVVTSLVQGVVSVGTDWVIALFPVVVLRGLNMAVKTKVVLGVLMGMGVFAGAAALKKMMHLNSLAVRPDVTWDVVDLTCWSMLVYLFEAFLSLQSSSFPPSWFFSSNYRRLPLCPAALTTLFPQSRAKRGNHRRIHSRHPPALLPRLQNRQQQRRHPRRRSRPQLRPRRHGRPKERPLLSG